MLATSTIPSVLKALLKLCHTSLTQVSHKAGILNGRLVYLFLTGEFTKAEKGRLVTCLQWEFARDFIQASQTGNFNQGGVGNEMSLTFINHISYITHNTVVIQGPPAVEETSPKALGGMPQRQQLQLMQLCGVVRQLQPVGAGLDAGKAA